MYVCRACLQRLNGVRTKSPFETRFLRPLRTNPSLLAGRRLVATSASKQFSGGKGPLQSRPQPLSLEEIREALESRRPQKVSDDEEDLDAEEEAQDFKSGASEKQLNFVVRKHLQYLKEPFEIGNHVRATLDKGRWDEALLLVRRASVNTKVEVSWNYLIDYQLKEGQLNAAIKLYNEMKKRGQQPNARTYTIIFSGCAESVHPKLAVSHATKLYNALLKKAVKTSFEPNTIHMNAVLGVCGRANDLDSMFTVLATADNKHRAPDSLTFTIVLNALRHQVSTIEPKMGQFTELEKANLAQESIQKAQSLWTDVLALWRAGKLLMDERLVVAMGQVLVTGGYKDNENIFHLLQQVMQIPSPERITRRLRRLAKHPVPGGEEGAEEGAEGAAEEAAENEAEEDEPDYGPDAFQKEEPGELSYPAPPHAIAQARKWLAFERAGQFPLPHEKTLSLVLKALENTKKTTYAAKYWEYFQKVYKVKPDKDNWAHYLVTLRRGHASTQAAAVIAAMPQEFLAPVTFRVGLKTCIDDRLNTKSFNAALKMFNTMCTKLRYPDPLSIRLFLHAARNNDKAFVQMEKKYPEAAKQARGEQLAVAIGRSWRPFQILVRSFSYPEKPSNSPEEALRKSRDAMQEAMATARNIISLIDIVCNDQMVKPTIAKDLWNKRKFLNLLVEQYVAKLYPQGPPGIKQKIDDLRQAGLAAPPTDPDMHRKFVDHLQAALRKAEGQDGQYDEKVVKALKDLGDVKQPL